MNHNMNKILNKKILLGFMPIFAALAFAFPARAANIDVVFAPDPNLTQANFIPLDETSGVATVTNNSGLPQTILTEAINVSDDDNFGSLLHLKITGTSGTSLTILSPNFSQLPAKFLWVKFPTENLRLLPIPFHSLIPQITIIKGKCLVLIFVSDLKEEILIAATLSQGVKKIQAEEKTAAGAVTPAQEAAEAMGQSCRPVSLCPMKKQQA